MALHRRKETTKQTAKRSAGQPRIDPAAVLERRSVGLPPSWWREVDALAARGKVKTAAIVRLAVGVYLKRMRKIDKVIKEKRRRE
ncbi:hypothetical protein Turpa_1048 [Turneriella parva DSM 21527]|uniref:Ribbon-helix-helix protein CopG domain-containing protein n=1 Tax=Turneriella parva (strain ATCC BAA-1111 / DSM 21527 / NCTC 11395 / H) TaxID=869212 RepID=I4B340_TURPD|nr:hypothetical protein Turpa_1048 [Turneriella parva DSM 21527]